MSIKQPQEIAEYLKSRGRVLILTGSLCDRVDFGDKTLADYAAEIAKKLDATVAAGANTPKGLKQRGVEKVSKRYAAEVVNNTRFSWLDPIVAERPEVLVLIGYPPVPAASLVGMAKDIETVVLGNTYVAGATYSLPDASASWSQWQHNLDKLVEALGS
jgi:CO dehydrogenase/acetyl-CoA synthase epsilon subunit